MAAPTDKAGRLVWELETDLSKPLAVGRGNVLYLRGWCYHTQRPFKRLTLLAGDRRHVIHNHSLAEPEVFAARAPRGDATGRSLTSGFWTALPFGPIAAPERAELSLVARLDDGTEAVARLGSIELVPGEGEEAEDFPARATEGEPLVAICMATYNPPPDLFRAQVESIVGQTYGNWVCVVSDDCSDEASFREICDAVSRDARFRVSRGPRRLGFYRNFERALRLAPRAADFVALSDHDDLWYPDKLASCLGAFREGVRLVYSDMDIVGRDGSPIHATYWTERRNNYTDLETLLFANTVTGASAVFRAEMLGELLPFPDLPGRPFHDHWMACVALAGGRVAYVGRALYAYRQHGGNVIGHAAGPPIRALSQLKGLAYQLYCSLVPWKPFSAFVPTLRAVYFDSVARFTVLSKALLLRTPAADAEKRAVLERFSGFEHSTTALCAQAAKYLFTRRPTLGFELLTLRAAAGMRLFKLYCRLARPFFLKRLLSKAARP